MGDLKFRCLNCVPARYHFKGEPCIIAGKQKEPRERPQSTAQLAGNEETVKATVAPVRQNVSRAKKEGSTFAPRGQCAFCDRQRDQALARLQSYRGRRSNAKESKP